MAAEVLTPIDEIGMPLPLAPIPTETLHDASPRDWHHHFHPRKSPLLQDLGGRALRESRLQLVYKSDHTDYHRYYEGPPLPETEQEKFALTVLSAAGYVPPQAIDIRQGDAPTIVKLTGTQRLQLWHGEDLKVARSDNVRKFLVEYTLDQGLEGVDESLIDEFLHTPNRQRSYHLGGILLDLAIDRAAEPIEPFYRTAWKRGYIRRDSAARVQRVIRTRMRVKQHRESLIDRLEAKLAA